MSKKLKPAYISKLCGELSDEISSGMTLNDGIYMLMSDNGSDPVLEKLLKKTSDGGNFSAAVKQTEAFPSYVEEMIEIGERTGHLDSVLSELAAYYARQEEISRNVKNAVTFPAVLLAILIIIVVVLLTQVLPVFNDVFNQLGVSMSSVAVTLMNVGNVIRNYAVAIVAVIAIAAAILLVLYFMPATHEAVLSIIKGKKLRKKMSSLKFASAMSMTISSGMDIDDSLEMSKKLCDKDTGKKISDCQEIMKSGVGFDKAVNKVEIFDPLNARRITVSFHTGKTDETMKRIADEYTVQVNESIDEKISRIEPALVIIMSLLVGFVLFSVMLPMLSVITTI